MSKKRGGKRSGAGRKPLPDSERRVTLIIYPKKKSIELLGGEVAAKAMALNAIES